MFRDFQTQLKSQKSLQFFDNYQKYIQYLKNYSQIYIPCDKCEIPHLYIFVLPSNEVQKNESLNLKASSVLSHTLNQQNPSNKQHDKSLYQKWTTDDKEQLKKCIINYGYCRWKQIQKSSSAIGGKLAERPKSEIRAFSNAFVRALAEQLTAQNADLKQFLYNMIDEYPDDPYITPQAKDWDSQTLNQRAIPFTKRLQLLYRIRILIKKYKDDQLKNIPDRDKEKINWEGLLNFLPNSLLYGQRPSVWWTKKHDTDLLRGVYKYGLLQPNDLSNIDNPNYQPKIHDLNLMFLVSNNGFKALNDLKSYPNYELYNFDLTEKQLFSRLEWLCDQFKELKDKMCNKKRKSDKKISEDSRKKPKFEINRDEFGKIIFPIQINSSLQLLATGEINILPAYHSEHNLFPVGFKSIRTHPSIYKKGVRCEYTNEILEGPEGKPIYRVTSEEDPDNPIVRESSTGCWVYICQRVNELQDIKKEKVTISGTERFGLLETNVVRLLEDLSNAEKSLPMSTIPARNYLNGIGSPFILNGKTKLASTWFLHEQGPGITTFITVFSNLNTIISYVFAGNIFGGWQHLSLKSIKSYFN
ncbi:hypothetical protein IMG5_183250 [Ichthyophthirius multifiliis]|uniref:Uncharacterized protein n=1 Tax=Ichthyophthirius multifiliis TaxID=5932 RepID=G0R354_ICHMU|nr:hypothetical protein IMG5_183250 [Ichthyophthirius multifiliis]EGR28103.1 hypothetical protein IMG5_183250 [Ichthyophthirius multifiliis]|eukprot:XP_004027448.1 hypothetical protein IMG5_183250 [Ichthyophthirius multifiliis]